MKFICNSNELMKRLSIVEKAISSRSSLPVLENVYFELENSILKLRGHDLELGIETTMPVQEGVDGKCLIKAKTVSSIVSKFQNQTLVFDEENQMVKITADNRVDFNILGSLPDEYPVFPGLESGVKVSLPVEDIKQLIQHTIFAVSSDETKHFLNGILVKNEGEDLVFVATDGYRLSLRKHKLASIGSSFSVIIPYKAMNECLKVLQQAKSDDVFEMTLSENQVSFQLKDVLFVSRVIQGQFPDYNQVLPKETLNSFSVSRRAFLDACERASIIAFSSNNVIRLVFSDDHLTIHANAPMGEFKESIQLSRLGGSGEARIAFNVRLILDSIKNLEMDDLRISFNNELSPCIVLPVSDLDYTYIIMPIRTSEYQAREVEVAASVTAS